MPVRVLWLIKGLGLGGAEKLLALAASHVDRSRFEYQLAFLLPWKTALVADLEAQGIPVTCLNHRVPWDPRVLSRLARTLRRERIDVLHAHTPYAGVVGRIAARLVRTPHVVYTEHNLQERYHPVTRVLNQATMRLCDLTIVVSDEVGHSLQASPFVKAVPVRTILNGVDADDLLRLAREGGDVREELNIAEDRLVVGVVNVFRPQKRLDLWVRAARSIAALEPRAVFVVVGEGPSRSDVEALARREGMEGRIHFPGLRRDAPRFMASFDVFMLASDYEGLPVAVLEAMALRTPVVATRVGGLPEVVDDGQSGYLVDPGAPDALAARVLTLLQTPAQRKAFGEAAAARVRERFSIARMVRETEGVYTRLIEGGAPMVSVVPEPAISGWRPGQEAPESDRRSG